MAAPIRNLCKSKGGFLYNFVRLSSARSYSQSTGNEFDLRYLDGEERGIAVFAFNRPASKNAINSSLLASLREAKDAVRFDKNIRVVILKSDVPGTFCAGADLKERVKMAPEAVGPFVAMLRQTLRDVQDLPMPTICALDGIAVGGGMEIALGCDMRVASKTAKMGLVETKLAIIPGGGGTQNLPRLVGPAIAKELIFTGRVLDGEQACQLGLVNRAVDQNEVGDAAYQASLELAKEIVTQGPIALRMAKAAISQGLEVDLNTGYAIEQMCYAQVIPTKDRIEGLTAFKEKRPPQYKGE